ncbi:MAG: gamma-glutamyltransferase [Rhodospirillaceae bacterium]|nr:gamma-glutamyltransferase [Rhodospirillaceae bacterium]
MHNKGAVAAGDSHTANAAGEILRSGGNAFDAAIGALLAATQAEPVLASLGGGGFLLARQASGKTKIFDFFAHTAQVKNNETDLYPVIADFGTVQQEFHIGQGSIATPGVVKGIFAIHESLGHMPLAEIAEPAIRLAREGLNISPLQAYIFDVVSPIYTSSQSTMRLYASPKDNGRLLGEGELVKNPDFADFLDVLVREGSDLFYKGEIAKNISRDCMEQGGHLRMGDFEKYSVFMREPLSISYNGATIVTNPPPSTGGILIAFALKLLEKTALQKDLFGSAKHIETLAKVMGLTNQARVECALGQNESAPETLLDDDFVGSYRNQVLGKPKSHRGTTHISVVDAKGNAAALTVSNGEGSGYVIPGTGVVLNNMLGEEDINPNGLGKWDTDTRMSSMMSPSILLRPDGVEYVLGSGGSNRIRTAILQVVLALHDFKMKLPEAITRPRIHFENNLLNIEAGYSEQTVQAMRASYENCKVWDGVNLFFGGVHGVMFDPKRKYLEGAGDPRRGGVHITV